MLCWDWGGTPGSRALLLRPGDCRAPSPGTHPQSQEVEANGQRGGSLSLPVWGQKFFSSQPPLSPCSAWWRGVWG